MSPRPKRPGPRVDVKINKVFALSGALWFLYGWVVFGMTYGYTNADKYNPDCPIMDGAVISWLNWTCYILLVFGGCLLANGGVVAKLYKMFDCVDEAICCRDLCQGFCGHILRYFLFGFVIINNFYGSYKMTQAYQQGLQSEFEYRRHTYCNKSIFEFSMITNVVIHGACFLTIVYGCISLFRFSVKATDPRTKRNKFVKKPKPTMV